MSILLLIYFLYGLIYVNEKPGLGSRQTAYATFLKGCGNIDITLSFLIASSPECIITFVKSQPQPHAGQPRRTVLT